MDSIVSLKMERAFFEGAYSVAYDLSSDMIKSGEINGMAFLYRALSEIGKSDLSTLLLKVVKADITFAFRQVLLDCKTVNTAEKYLNNGLMMCSSIADTLKENLNILDGELKEQYQGSAGITLDSDDPAIKVKEEQQRAHNNDINRQRNYLSEKYENIVACLFEIAFTTILETPIMLNNKSEVTLEFIEFIEKLLFRVDISIQKKVKTYISEVKKARNEQYWKTNAKLYKRLKSEKEEYEGKIAKILSEKIAQCEKEIQEASIIKEDAKKKRKHYSLFNFKARKPYNKTISKARKTIKHNEELKEQYRSGVCEECKYEQKMLNDIIVNLTAQR